MSQLDQLRPTRAGLEALGWRAWWTFVATFSAILAGAGLDWIDAGLWQMAATAGMGAVFTVLKGYSSQKLGTGSA